VNAVLPAGPSGVLRSTYRVLRSPFRDFPRWAARYGDPFTIPTVNGTVVITGDPELIKVIFSADPQIYGPWAVDALGPTLGQRSIFMLEGAPHTRERKLLAPPLHGDRMRAYADVIAQVARRRFAERVESSRVLTLELAQAISLEVITRAIFGARDDESARALQAAVIDLVEASSPLMFFMPFLQREFAGLGPWARFRRRFVALDALLQQQIDRARRSPGVDVCSLLAQATYDDGEPMPDAAIRDELRTMLFAGHETTAITIAWAIELLHRHPEALARVHTELEALGPDPDPEAIARLEYLDAVCKEAMRLYPVVTEVLRVLRAPLRLGAVEVPAGIGVSASALLAHRREDLYPDAETFRPERFLERRFSPFEYLPFGGGHRRCIGAAFATFEMKIVLGVALSRHRLTLLDDGPATPVRRNVTMAPGGGVPIRVRDR
jgi:cytochrome P450